jgi:hypothetical protein
LIAIVLLILMLGGLTSELRAEDKDLPAAEQSQLAEQFAPVLVFHPDERYFPTNPLFPIEPAIMRDDAGLPFSILGTPDSRTAFYRELSIEEKAKIATVYYRAYPARSSGQPVVVLEYWFYYVRNEYRVRSNVLPLWLNGTHPNDMEHIHLVLREEDGGYFVDEAYASAHEGKIPANRYKYQSARQAGPTRFLVELGSHALAPDIDEDGVFTPGTDGNSGSKMQWGIRDRGYTWPRYRKSYMTVRSTGNAIVFAHGKDDTGFFYRLVPVDSITENFEELKLTDSQRKRVFENQTSWFTRVFGRDNGRSGKLVLPPRLRSGGEPFGIGGASSPERRFMVGTVLSVDEPGLFVGGRYSYLTPHIYLPDLLFQIDGIVTRHDKYLAPQFLLSYPFDGFTRIMAGKSLVTDSLKFGRRQWDTVGTIEVRLGDMRISATTRSTGQLRSTAKEFRLFYAF